MYKLIAKLLAWRPIRDWIIRRAERTPYSPICYADGKTVYMERYWLFNRYDLPDGPRFPRLPSIRVHWILLPDEGRDLHTHPWTFRTFVMSGAYYEERPGDWTFEPLRLHRAGCTYRMGPDDAHRITDVSPNGAFTLFVTGRKTDTWGFLTARGFVPWREYLNRSRSV